MWEKPQLLTPQEIIYLDFIMHIRFKNELNHLDDSTSVIVVTYLA
jgi:hypothetical protein